ncbi:MAG: leucine-rich repeat domain-containing protein, partial [Anaeroplasmataceae bacterium]|nr:leucine-rich repeat domain-containing protein [Anaeroplasmataceae bacterium]
MSSDVSEQLSSLEKDGRIQLASSASDSVPYVEPAYSGMSYAYVGNNDGEKTITLTGLIPSRNTSCHRGYGSEFTNNGSPAISIPSTYDGYTVTRIASNFSCQYVPYVYSDGCRHYNIVSPSVVKLPSTLLRIENNAFAQGVTNFWASNGDRSYAAFEYTKFDLSLCENLQYIGSNAFYTSSSRNGRQIVQIAEYMPYLETVGANAFRNAFRVDYDTNDNINMSNIKHIGDYAFGNDVTLASGYSYTALRGVNMGSSLETLGNYAFYNCDGLENVDVPATCEKVGDYAFATCQNLITATVRTPNLGVGTFKDDASLVSVRISDFTEEIPDYCFQSCNALSVVTLYPSYEDISTSLYLERIGVNAFSNTNLSTFQLPINVNEIGDNAFADCRGLLEFDFSIASEHMVIGDCVLKGCSNLEIITIPGDLFDSCGIDFLRDATLLSTVTFLKKNVLEPGFFAGCANLTTINFAPEDVITRIPDEYFRDCVKLAHLSFITTEGDHLGELSYTIESIGDYAFYNTAFENITITNAVDSVGRYAFANMQELTYASVNSKDISYRMFYNCPMLETLYVGPNASNVLKETEENISTYVFDYTNNMEQIVNASVQKNAAFANCVRLENITLECPTLGAYMFDGCASLETIELKSTIRTVETHAFANCPELYEVTLLTNALGEFMFANDTKLKNITLNPTTTTIPKHAFYRSNLDSISIPSSVTTVGDLAFAYSLSLKTADLNECQMISPYMFYNCIALQEITIPENVGDNVGDYAFANCTALKNATILNSKISNYMFYNDLLLCAPSTSTPTLRIDSNVLSVGEHAFAKTGVTIAELGVNQISDYMFEDCDNLQELIIGIVHEDDTVSAPEIIGVYSFKGCAHLNRVTLNIKKIGAHMFDGCLSLTYLTLGSPIELIDEYAFANCSSLSSVSTSALVNLKEIKQYAFANCTNLDSFIVPDSVQTLGLGVFNNCASLNTLTIPFVGERLHSTANPETPSAKTVFGYIFGTVASENAANITSKFSASGSASYYIPTGLNNVIITKEKTVLYGSFYGCTMLRSINIPTDTERIESYAFYGCTGLTNFIVPSTVKEIGTYVLAECSNLRESTLECSIMGTYMFYNCVRLHTTHLKNVQYVSTSAYEGCVSLEIVDLNQGNGSAGYICTAINQKAFFGCENLSTLEFPSTITTIGPEAFKNCLSLTFITLPANLVSLEAEAFNNCDSLVSIVIPSKLDDIGLSVFVGCDNLTSVLFTNKIVGQKMFEGCNSLRIIDLGEVEQIGAFAFNQCTISDNRCVCTNHRSSLEQLILPNTLTTIGEKAFFGCSSIEELVVPESVRSFGYGVFQYCTGLKYVTLKTRYMGTAMFRDCRNLLNVAFGADVSAAAYGISSEAFYGCHNLLFPELPANITSIGDYAFAQNYRNTVLEIPKTISSIGRNAFWDVDVEELIIPFVGVQRGEAHYTDKGSYAYSRNALGWIFGASAVTMINGTTNLGSGAPYSTSGKSYACTINYNNSYWTGWYKTETWYLPVSLKKVTVTDDRIISYTAFWSARTLTDITIEDTVQVIREASMYNCTSLTNLTVPFIGTSRGASGVATTGFFYANSNPSYHASSIGAWFLTMGGGYSTTIAGNNYDSTTPETVVSTSALTMPYTVYSWSSSVYNRARYQVPTTLKNVTIKDVNNGTSIGLEEAAFYNCSMIQNITIIGRLTKIGKNALYNTGLSSFDIPSTVSSVGEGAFAGMKNLESIAVRTKVISKGMFKGATSLKFVDIIGENVVIEDNAFENCTALVELNFRNAVASVGEAILAGCSALETLYINVLGKASSGGTTAGSNNFGYLFGKTAGTGLVENTIQTSATATEKRYLPANLTLHYLGANIPSYAFAGVSSLQNIILHEGVKNIGDYAFIDTTGLQEVRLPSTLEDCGIYAFKNSGLVTAYFGEGLETIHEGMFANCTNLENLIFESTTITYEYRYVSNNVFEEYKKVGYTGSFLSTGKYISAGKDFTIGTADDIENIIYSGEFYIDNHNGTFYAYGKDTLLGTDDDILIGVGSDNSFGTDDDFVFAVISGKYYKDFLDSTYCTVTIQQAEDDTWNYAFGSTKYGIINGVLTEVVVDQKANIYKPITNSDYILFQSSGKDGLIGTDDDRIVFLGLQGTDYTNITDAIIYDSVLVHDGKLYYDYKDNTYQEIIETETGFALDEIFGAGPDTIIGTEDDISKY